MRKTDSILNHLSYEERARHCVAPLGQKIFALMVEKQSNLALSADVTSAQALLDLAHQLGPEICLLKTHIDIISDFHQDLIHELKSLANKHHFLLFEDRKFADIGHTVKNQYEKGIYRIADWADVVNAHALPGPYIVQGLLEVAKTKQQERGLLLIAEMSSKGHLLDTHYMQKTLAMADSFKEFVFGFITQHVLSQEPHWINMSPGILRHQDDDSLGQQYTTPEKAIIDHGTDVIIVGRGITKAQNPLKEARYYREQGWACYLERCKK